VTNVVVIH